MSNISRQSIARSHSGRHRQANEDAYLARPAIGLWAIADGMGGHDHGAAASRAVVDHLAQLSAVGPAPERLRAVGECLRRCHSQLDGLAASGRPPGSTVVVLLLIEDSFAAIWAGDSRLYRYRNSQLSQLTADHRDRLATNRITRAVGAGVDLALDVVQGEVEADDLFLLCSDGLTCVLDDRAIESLIDPTDLEASANQLLDRALEGGAPDNVTFILIGAAKADPDATMSPVMALEA